MKQPHKHAAMIHAWADGADIQCRPDSSSAWADMRTNPSWFEGWEYRVKPEKKPDFAQNVKAHLGSDGRVRVWLISKGANLRLTFDGETGALKSAEIL